MAFQLRFPSPARLPGLIALATGAALVLAAAIRAVAWNWSVLPDTARLGLAGSGVLLCLLLALTAERQTGFRPGEKTVSWTGATDGPTGHTFPHGTAGPVPAESGGLAGAAAGLAMLGAGLCLGLFWAVFTQTFQSGATERVFCLVWAACVVPLFVLRRSAGLWNLLVVLLCGAACGTSRLFPWFLDEPGLLLRLGGAAAVCCMVAPKRNAWLVLPLTVLIGAATWLCVLALMDLLSPGAYGLSRIAGPATFAGPVALATVLAFALRTRHGLALGELALSTLVLLNVLILYAAPFHDLLGALAVFLLVNLAWLCALTMLVRHGLSRLRRPGTPGAVAAALCLRLPAALGGLLSALCLLGLITLLLAERHLDMAVPLAAVGLVLILGGTILWRMRGNSPLAATFALVSASGGLIGLHLDLYGHDPVFILCLTCGASALLYAGINMPLMRFAAVFAALWTGFVTLQDAGLDGLLSVTAVCCLLPLGLAATGRFPHKALRQAALACILTPALLSPRLPLPFQLHLTPDLLGDWLPAALLTLNLALLIRRMLPPRQSPAAPRPAEYAAGILALLLGWRVCPPECLLALNLLFAGLAGTASTRTASTARRGISTGKAGSSLPSAAETATADRMAANSMPANSTAENNEARASGGTAATPAAGTDAVQAAEANLCRATACDATLLLAGLFLLAASLTGFYMRLKLPHLAYVLSLAGPGICLMGAGFQLNRRIRQAEGIRHAQPSVRPSLLRHALPFALTAAVLSAAGGAAIADRSAILRDGRDVLLALRPIDPHAFLMGDYMELEYELDRLIPDATGPGCLPLHPNAAGYPQIAPETFIPDSTCKGVPSPALRRKTAASGFLFFDLPRRYYFEAGQARQYERAAFAVLRCDRNNRCLLAGLAGKDRKRLGPAR